MSIASRIRKDLENKVLVSRDSINQLLDEYDRLFKELEDERRWKAEPLIPAKNFGTCYKCDKGLDGTSVSCSRPDCPCG